MAATNEGANLMRLMLLAIVICYRQIPEAIRKYWAFGKSTSHLALADLQSGKYKGIAAIRIFAHYAIPKLGFPFDFWGMPPSSMGRQPVNWDN